MLAAVAVLAVLAVLAVVRLREPIGPVAGVLAAGVLAAVGWTAGLDAGGFAPLWVAAGAGAIAAGYAVAVAVPPIRRRAFRETPYRMGAGAAAYTGLVLVPLATVLLEEVAFRGVVWGLVEREHGAGWAAAVSAVLFGLWHARPRRDRPVAVLGTVLFTTAAGVLFAVLRQEGGLAAPIAAHWAANGIGVMVAAWMWRRR